MKASPALSPNILEIDAASEAGRIAASIRDLVLNKLRRRGAVVGVSGGIDSAVVAFLCARALGPERVLILFTPEADSSSDSLRLGKMLAASIGAPSLLEDITPILQAAGCYERRDAAIRQVAPEYGPRHKCKLVLPDLLSTDRYPIYFMVVQSPDGETRQVRLTADAYLGVLAATNLKQRTRKMVEYYHADRKHYVVAGTPNRLEYDQGFFVRYGDGAADLKPIAHLYKSQVYQLAEYLGVPQEIQSRVPTTDTYSLEQSQEEFYFSLPLEKMDLCLYGKNSGIAASELAPLVGLAERQVERVYKLIEAKRNATRYLHMSPALVEPIPEV
jgi:NAD+ synthase